jgi:hypothetical protein
MNLDSLEHTIVITSDTSDTIRGYSLMGREFRIKNPIPETRQVKSLDGIMVEDEFWVVDVNEYVNVVPESSNDKFDGDEVLIPKIFGRYSVRSKEAYKNK